MESTRSLAQVIMEMRDEIKKLEAENRELRGDFSQRYLGVMPREASPVSTAVKQPAGKDDNSYVNLRRNASAPVLEGHYKNTVMTVRSKVKTVTFLLPVDDIYTSRPALTKHQEDPKLSDLDSITETDS
uniref:Si:ch211-235m3.10 n=1 Tax=Amphilophus citrinellus TaxID=61819 RepID=A0A3Q0QW02_AMPCI